jgi:hypothetical protein
MSVELKELDNGKLLEVHLTGKLIKTEYETFLPAWSGWSNSSASS